MELALSLGDSCKNQSSSPSTPRRPTAASEKKKKRRSVGLDFCMDLGLAAGDDDGADRVSGGDLGSRDSNGNSQERTELSTPLQLNLLPLAPVPRRNSPNFLSLPLSSDNGSSENGSSPAAKGLDVNRAPVSPSDAEESVPLTNGERNPHLEGGDDDENGPNSRKKLRLTKEQSIFLEESFKEHHTLNPKQKVALAKQLNLRPRQVEVWFQNRRARTKLKQTEVDCDYLKRCCETLSEENRRLHKELQELRALKAASAGSPFYAHLPATTLTMCPSCERVATAAPPPAATAGAKPGPFPRTNFFPFSQTPTAHPNQPAAS